MSESEQEYQDKLNQIFSLLENMNALDAERLLNEAIRNYKLKFILTIPKHEKTSE